MKTQFDPCQKSRALTMKFAIRALGFTLAAFTLATSTWAGEVFRVKGPIALAVFATVEGCIVTLVDIEAVARIEHEPPGPSNSSSQVQLAIDRFDRCNQNIELLSAFGSATLSDSDFQVGKKLEAAKLIKTIEVSDSVSGSSFDVSIDVTWTATGQPEKTNNRFQRRSPDGFSSSKERGTFREASAAGTVSDGTTNFIQTAEVLFADLRDVTEGFVEVIKF